MQHSHPLLSICIPTYNRSGWLRASLSVLAPQVYAAGDQVELIVSDNCSTDRTAQIVEEAQAWGPIRYHCNETNVGANPNVFRLVSELAQGKYTWVLGDDDFVRAGVVQKILDVLLHYPHLDYVYANYGGHYGGLGMESPPEALKVQDLDKYDFTGSADLSERPVTRVADLVGADENCFTPVYCSILPRAAAIDAFRASLADAPFSTLNSVVSHAVYIADTLLDKPCYYIGQPCVVCAGPVSWSRYMPVYLLVLLPELFAHFEHRGIARCVLDVHRRVWLTRVERVLTTMVRQKETPGRERFDFGGYVRQNGRFAELWRLLFSMILHEFGPTAFALRHLNTFRPTALLLDRTRQLLARR